MDQASRIAELESEIQKTKDDHASKTAALDAELQSAKENFIGIKNTLDVLARVAMIRHREENDESQEKKDRLYDERRTMDDRYKELYLMARDVTGSVTKLAYEQARDDRSTTLMDNLWGWATFYWERANDEG